MNTNPLLWVLMDLDHKVDVVGQFVPEDVSRGVSAELAVEGSVGRDHPIVMWIRGEAEEVTFRARLWATDAEDFSVEDRLVALENLVRRSTELERPPICAFAWGISATLTMDCLVKSVGGVSYDEVRPDGSLRGVSLTITLIRYEEVSWEATDPSVPEHHTRIRRARRGDTYESIALDEYGDAQLGAILRQLNPRGDPGMPLADLRADDGVHVLPEDFLRRQPMQPRFHAFRTGPGYEAAEQRRREIIEERGGDRFSVELPGEEDA